MAAATGRPFTLRSLPNGWTVGRFTALTRVPGVVHAVTTRSGPAFGPSATSPQTAAAVGEISLALGLREAAWCHQVHGHEVVCVTCGGLAGHADALVTETPGVGLVGRSADCPLVLAAAPKAGAVGVAHASWRGTVRQVTAHLVSELTGRFGALPGEIVAGIAPSAGPCCYEVGPEVLAAAREGIGPHAAEFFRERRGRLTFDLWAANYDQLLSGGVLEENIQVAGLCTLCRNDVFPSHRREGAAAGRFAAVIALAPEAAAGPGAPAIA